MGTKGLWKYLNLHGVCTTPPAGKDDPRTRSPDHLILDMNSIVHAAICGSVFTSNKTIEDVVAAVKKVAQRCAPTTTLALVFDGAAPVAKLRLQKERRSSMPCPQTALEPTTTTTSSGSSRNHLKYNYDYQGKAVQLSRSEVISGSEFLLACEDALRSALMPSDGNGDCKPGKSSSGYSVIINGCENAGEGELKIASIIRALWMKQQNTNTYTGDDTIVIVGNDSDLVLVCVACTPYSKYYIVNPECYTVTAVGELFADWRKGFAKKLLSLDLLPSYRIDFVFIMLLGGGDWFEGVGDRTIALWRRYRELRLNCGYFKKSLIRGENFDVNIEFLRDLTCLKESPHHKMRQSKIKQAIMRGGAQLPTGSIEHGVDLLKGAMWALKSIIAGRCFDYSFRVSSNKITVGMLREACFVKGLVSRMRPESSATLPLFSPLEQCLGVLGKRGRYSAEIVRILKEVGPDGGEKLTYSTSVSYIVSQVRLLMDSVDRDKLTPAERELLKVQHGDVFDDGCGVQDAAVTFMSYTYTPNTCN